VRPNMVVGKAAQMGAPIRLGIATRDPRTINMHQGNAQHNERMKDDNSGLARRQPGRTGHTVAEMAGLMILIVLPGFRPVSF